MDARAQGGVLVATKLHIPARRPGLVPRDALVGLLTAPGPRRLTLVDAHPGAGKTTLLGEWAAAPGERRRFAWLSLDDDDNDPARFWTGVVAALRTVAPGVGARAEAALRAAGGELTRTVLPLLLNDLAEHAEPIVLVLDDYHVIADAEVHRSLAYLIDHLPPAAHVAIATRADPPLPLARLRARGEIVEIRSGDLRFSEAEAAAFLNGTLGLDLPADAVALLQRRTEGWAAGLQLAGLSLRGRSRREAFIAAFSGDDRQIVDYLGSEVLAAQPPEVRAFLLQTAILERLSGPLCDAVTGGAGSAARLVDLERANLFVVPLDSRRHWYRYHHLFAGLLRDELERTDPALRLALHRRASAWHAQAGNAPEAIHHALAARDFAAARDLVAEHWAASFNQGQLATVARWLAALPADDVLADQRLVRARIFAALDRGRLEEAEPWIDAAARRAAGDPGHASWAALLRGLHRFKAGDVGAAAQLAGEAAERGDGGAADPFRAAVAACLAGLTAYWQGREDGARAAFGEARLVAEAAHNRLAHTYALGYLALIAADGGRARAAAEPLERVAALARAEARVSEHFVAMVPAVARGALHAHEGRLSEARAELRRAVELAERGAGVLEHADALRRLAGVEQLLGERAEARRLLALAADVVAACADPGRLAGALAADRERLAAGAGVRRRDGASHATADGDGDGELSDRELAVLRLLPTDLSQREIGDALYLSINTVKTHVRSIYAKLRVGTRGEAVARARELRLL